MKDFTSRVVEKSYLKFVVKEKISSENYQTVSDGEVGRKDNDRGNNQNNHGLGIRD